MNRRQALARVAVIAAVNLSASTTAEASGLSEFELAQLPRRDQERLDLAVVEVKLRLLRIAGARVQR